MKLKINPKTISSGIITSLIKERLSATKGQVKEGVNLVDIAKKLVAKRFPDSASESRNGGGD